MPEPLQENAPRRGLPRWLIALQGGVAVAVVAAIVVAVLALRAHGPQVIKLDHPDATAEALNADTATPDPLAELPSSGSQGPLGALTQGAPVKGKPAADFALLDLNGRRVQLSDLRGKVVVINFWATWCGPCKQEFPELEKVAATLNNDVVVLALDQRESGSRVTQFRDTYGATFPILLDSRAEVAKSYLLTGIPDTIIVDRNGIVADVSLGPLSAGTFRYKINQVLQAH